MALAENHHGATLAFLVVIIFVFPSFALVLGRHGGAVVRAAASTQEGCGFDLSVRTLHALPVSVWVLPLPRAVQKHVCEVNHGLLLSAGGRY